MIYIYHVVLAAISFLIMLNGFLRGSKKAQIDAALGVTLVGLLVTGFVVFGWQMGALALVLALVYGRINRPLAAAAAARILAVRRGASGRYKGLPDRVLESISRDLGQPLNFSNVEQMITRSEQ